MLNKHNKNCNLYLSWSIGNNIVRGWVSYRFFRRGSSGKLTINDKTGHVVVSSAYEWKLDFRVRLKIDEDRVDAFGRQYQWGRKKK